MADVAPIRSTRRACWPSASSSLVDVANVSDRGDRGHRAELGVQGLADFVSALLVIEQRLRLRLAWEQLFGDQDAS